MEWLNRREYERTHPRIYIEGDMPEVDIKGDRARLKSVKFDTKKITLKFSPILHTRESICDKATVFMGKGSIPAPIEKTHARSGDTTEVDFVLELKRLSKGG